jgi:glycosyltransferase involved in cell wall biosynthesis
MNICQIITPSKIAGAERSTTSLCEHLQRAGHRVVIGCKSGSPLIDAMRGVGLDARPLSISGKANLRAPFRVAAFARGMDAAVIHSQLSTAAWHGSLAGRLAKLPSIAHVRALNTPLWYRWATRVIAVSRAVKQHLVERGMDGSKIDVVYNGIDPARYYVPCSREEARRPLGLPEAGLLVGVVAHLTPKKGHAVFLQALASVAARHPEASALFLGEGGEREALAAQAKRLGIADRVLFAGFHPDVLPYYAAMDVVVLPSIGGEGLPRALLEGGLLRRPAIGTRLSGVPEIIRDGETGFVVPVGDAAALAGRLELLLGDPALRERMGNAAHDYVAATFTVQAMVAGTLETYRRAGVEWER